MGRELCVQLAAEGANIAMCDMGEAGMAETKAICLEANNGGATVTTFTCDVSDESQVIAWCEAVEQAHDTGGRIALFSNAGIGGGGSFVADPRERWEKTFDVNFWGVYYCNRAFMPMLLGCEQGAIVNTASINGFFASVGPTTPHTVSPTPLASMSSRRRETNGC